MDVEGTEVEESWIIYVGCAEVTLNFGFSLCVPLDYSRLTYNKSVTGLATLP